MPKLSVLVIILLITALQGVAQKKLNAAEFSNEITGEKIQLLDVRTSAEFSKAHIANAMQANWNNLSEFTTRVKALDKQKPVYVYCLVGARSNEAANWLQKKGFTTVQLTGGLMQWQKQLLPTTVTKNVSSGLLANNFLQKVKEYPTAIVIISTTWCPPCRLQAKETHMFKTKYQQPFLWELDGDEHANLVSYFGIESFPTTLYFQNGTLVKKEQRVVTANELATWIKP